jgi:hypothetical protein
MATYGFHISAKPFTIPKNVDRKSGICLCCGCHMETYLANFGDTRAIPAFVILACMVKRL